MPRFSVLADQENIYDFLRENRDIQVGDIIDYITSNQEGTKQYRVVERFSPDGHSKSIEEIFVTSSSPFLSDHSSNSTSLSRTSPFVVTNVLTHQHQPHKKAKKTRKNKKAKKANRTRKHKHKNKSHRKRKNNKHKSRK